MHTPTTWTDGAQRQWNCSIRLEDAWRLRDKGIDLFDADSIGKSFENVLSTIEFAAELMRPQWSKAGLTYEQFADVMIESEGMLATVHRAMTTGLADFFRRVDRPALAMVIERAFQTARSVETQSLENACGPRMTEFLDQVKLKAQRDFDKRMNDAIAELGADPEGKQDEPGV